MRVIAERLTKIYRTMPNTDIQTLIDHQDPEAIRQFFADLQPVEIANHIEGAGDEIQPVLFSLVGPSQKVEVFRVLSHDVQHRLILDSIERGHDVAGLLNDMGADDRTAFLKDLSGETLQNLIQRLSPEARAVTTLLLGYPKESIGRLMTPEYVSIRPHHTIGEVFDIIRKYGRDSETFNVVYIVDDEGHLIDDIRIRELILASPDQPVESLMDRRFVSLNAMDDQETAIRVFKDYDRVALPVTDRAGVLLGIVTIDDIMDVVELEGTEDFHKFGAFQTAVVDPLKTRIFQMYKNRIVWLTALVFMNIFSGAALAGFEDTIQAVVSLVFFLPLLIDSGGNAGSQSATLMVRSLAMGDVKATDWYRLIGKEILVSLLLGGSMALAVSAIAWFRAPEILWVVSLTMVVIVMIGSMVGMLLPFLFTRFNLDPATASAPLITSISDICGVLVYFTIATWYFGL